MCMILIRSLGEVSVLMQGQLGGPKGPASHASCSAAPLLSDLSISKVLDDASHLRCCLCDRVKAPNRLQIFSSVYRALKECRQPE